VFTVIQDNFFKAADGQEVLPKGFQFEKELSTQNPDGGLMRYVEKVASVIGVTFTMAMALPLLIQFFAQRVIKFIWPLYNACQLLTMYLLLFKKTESKSSIKLPEVA